MKCLQNQERGNIEPLFATTNTLSTATTPTHGPNIHIFKAVSIISMELSGAASEIQLNQENDARNYVLCRKLACTLIMEQEIH